MIWFLVPLGLLIYALYEYTWFKVVRIKLKDSSNKAATIQSKRLVFISDLQYDNKLVGFRHYAARKLMREIKDLNPACLLIGGDMIHRNNRFSRLIFDYLETIPCDKIAILGNHDFYNKDLVLSEYERLGVRVLRNETMVYEDIQIVGIEHPLGDTPTIPSYSRDRFTLVLSHGPDLLVGHNVQGDYMLAGHLHAGQVTFFGMYAPITNSAYKEKYLHGHKTVGVSPLYVSSGCGGYVGFLPIRFFARPEIVVLDF